jgi:peptide deformylase
MLQLKDQVLSKKALPVVDLSEMGALFVDMINLMQQHNGVGLAAPQAGISKRVFIFTLNTGAIEMAINPQIKQKIGAMIPSEEGCLSHPGLQVTVPRFPEIQAAYYDVSGTFRSRHLKGQEAIIFQHEMDHINGKTILSYIK